MVDVKKKYNVKEKKKREQKKKKKNWGAPCWKQQQQNLKVRSSKVVERWSLKVTAWKSTMFILLIITDGYFFFLTHFVTRTLSKPNKIIVA
jgi:hypothetical protein